MTKYEAKKLSIMLWTYLARTGNETKSSWPLAEKYKLSKQRYECFLCTVYHEDDKCNECPLAVAENFGGCPTRGSKDAFTSWLKAVGALERKQYAQRIVDLIKASQPKKKRLFFFLPIIVLLAFASIASKPLDNAYFEVSPFRDPILSCCAAAEAKTGVNADLLAGIRFVESSNRPDPKHTDPFDTGSFGLHETPAIHAEREKLFGRYDANDLYDAAFLTARNYQRNVILLRDARNAIAAHNQGVYGVRRDGPRLWYIDRVLTHARAYNEAMI